MTQHELQKYLFDIFQACNLIEAFVANKSFAEYDQDLLLQSAVERQCGIIGEALKRAVTISPEIESQISHVSRIISFRNKLIHGYAAVSSAIVWGVVEGYIPLLKKEVSGLLPKV